MRVREAYILITYLTLASFVLVATASGQEGQFPPFDRYGKIAWQEEQVRLDNFAIQLINHPETIGYMFVYDANEMCAGEAQTRVMRAKRYLVERRGVPWNQVIWRIDGYDDGFRIFLQPVNRAVPIPYPFVESILHSPKRHVTKQCRSRMAAIKPRW